MSDFTVAVAALDCGKTPIMPYVGRFDGKIFAEHVKYLTIAALLRCGFDAIDVKQCGADCQDGVMTANRFAADGLVVVSYGAFGSRKSFNDVNGMNVKYSPDGRNKVFAEDVCAKLLNIGRCVVTPYREPRGAACPAIMIEGGYLTDFDDAKKAHDPDCRAEFAEYAVMGICEYADMPYIPRDESAYPAINTVNVGARGLKIKQLQALLCADGYITDIDGVAGRNTALAAKTFAVNNDIAAGDNILSRLALPEYNAVYLGESGVGVKYVQHKLRSKLYPATLGNTLDVRTIDAANEFLRETGADIPPCSDCIAKEIIELLKPAGGGRARLF